MGGKKYIAHPLPCISSLFQFSSKPSPDVFFSCCYFPSRVCGHLVRPRLLTLQYQDSFDGWGCHSVTCWVVFTISSGLLRCTSGSWWQLQVFGDGNLWEGPWSRLNERAFPSPKILLIWFWIFWCPHFPPLFGLGLSSASLSISLESLAIQFHWNIVKKQLLFWPSFHLGLWRYTNAYQLVFLTSCFLLIPGLN